MKVQSPEAEVSIIVVNWNTRQMLADCLNSVETSAVGVACEVIVVDNDSTDGSQAMLRSQFPQVRLIQNDRNVGFARANNQALAASRGRYALLLNSDALLSASALQAMLKLAESEPRAGIVGACLLNADGSFQASYTLFPHLWQEFLILSGLGRLFYGRWYPSRGPEENKEPHIVDYVEGACLLVRREAFEEVGGLDEDYFMYAEEVDWCYAMREKGWQVWYQPAARVIHLGGGSSQGRQTRREADLYRSRVRFFQKHYGSGTAWLLKLQIYAFVAIKTVVHRLLRWVSSGRYGRQVVPLHNLVKELNE
jgi:N-acetylglucosaminyl-diphospho-decaprenol L-rhamnosyltransferase